MRTAPIEQLADEVALKMQDRMSVGGKGLAAKLRRAGRLLPRDVRRQALFLAEAEKLVQNPKLIKMIDPAKVQAAHRICLGYLDGLNPGERRKRMLLSMVTSTAFAILVVAGLYIAVLVWRGFL